MKNHSKTKVSINLLIVLLLGVIVAMPSCSKKSEVSVNSPTGEFSGMQEFLPSLYKLANVQTKAGELSIDEAKEIIEPMLESSETFLLANGFNYQEDFDEGDPNIVITALALMECGLYSDAALTPTKVDFWDVTSCVLTGVGAKDIVVGGAKMIAKRIAKQIIARAIPYVGAAVWATTSAACIIDLYY